jgi:dolichyl-phosphate beta-glucosyltransferase
MTDIALTLVIPCYNEAERLNAAALQRALRDMPWLRLTLVDDGSTDATAAVLESIRATVPERVLVVTNAVNAGKAEAVRQGLLRALQSSVGASRAHLAGFWDADLSAPLSELPAMLSIFEQQPDVEWVWGIRLRSLGRAVTRSALRHYLGRGFATATSLALNLGTYDTQCGAKLFRLSPLLAAVVAEPFQSRWVFDVEMLSRADELLQANRGYRAERVVHEHPLRIWTHRPGSKIHPAEFLRALLGLRNIRAAAPAWRRTLPELRSVR